MAKFWVYALITRKSFPRGALYLCVGYAKMERLGLFPWHRAQCRRYRLGDQRRGAGVSRGKRSEPLRVVQLTGNDSQPLRQWRRTALRHLRGDSRDEKLRLLAEPGIDHHAVWVEHRDQRSERASRQRTQLSQLAERQRHLLPGLTRPQRRLGDEAAAVPADTRIPLRHDLHVREFPGEPVRPGEEPAPEDEAGSHTVDHHQVNDGEPASAGP